MGDDGHTLSLFPGTEVVHEKKAWVKAFFPDARDMYRITLTAPVVNNAAAVVFLATGNGKALTLQGVIEGEFKPDTYPSQVIKPTEGELHWFIDEAAASALQV
ncbi:6-phosphogluconolactonase [Chitinophaga sedimenti]|uniref:6-phosphogluconolactonase n=1 Tax=Chitinophaga sedimenti TaxID=2033606 RepID=UPI00249DE1CB|nr:6-phosphogluconolactonase [Chitinophaga sedimenti]